MPPLTDADPTPTPARLTRRQRLKQVAQMQLVRYIFSAGIATLVDVCAFALLFNLYFSQPYYDLGFAFKPSRELLALSISYTMGVVVHFAVSRLLVFQDAPGRKREQFSRFLLVAVVVFGLNHLLTKALLNWLPTLLPFLPEKLIPLGARGLSAVSIGLASFVFHKHFTFRAKRTPGAPEDAQ